MVYRFKIVSDEVEKFCREIEINSSATFLQLRNAILDSVGYHKEELSSFFLCSEDWEKHEEITLEDMGSSSDEDIWLMEDTTIGEMVEDEGQRLIFVFDYMTDRCFFMELKEIIPSKNIMDPLCVRKEGKAPRQNLDIKEFEKELDKKAAKTTEIDMFDEEFYGSDQYSADELPEGFGTFN